MVSGYPKTSAPNRQPTVSLRLTLTSFEDDFLAAGVLFVVISNRSARFCGVCVCEIRSLKSSRFSRKFDQAISFVHFRKR